MNTLVALKKCKKTNFFFLLLILLIPKINQAQWTKFSSPLYGSVEFFKDINEKLFSFSYSKGLLRSSDNGNTWTKINFNTNGMKIYNICNNNSLLYMATSSGIYTSLDTGSTWSLIPKSPIGASTDIICLNNAIYVIRNNQIFRTIDNGNTWDSLFSSYGNSLGNFELKKLSVVGSDLIVSVNGISGGGYIKFNYNTPKTMVQVNTPFTSISGVVKCLGNSILFHNPSYIYLSKNQGVNFIDLSSKFPKKFKSLSAYLVKNYYIVSLIDSLSNIKYFKTLDSGSTWTEIPFHIDNQPFEIVASGPNLFYRERDTYSSSSFGCSSIYYTIYQGISDYGVFKSSDNGITWSHLDKDLTYPYVRTLFTDANNTLYLNTNGTGLFKYNPNISNWEHKDKNYCILGAGFTYNRLVTYTTSYPKFSDDAGNTWNWPNWKSNSNYNPVLTADKDALWLIRDSLLVSKDSGNTWINVCGNMGQYDRQINFPQLFTDGPNAYFIVYRGIYVSNNYGLSWSFYTNIDQKNNIVYWMGFDNNHVAYATSWLTSNYSEDNGKTWTTIPGSFSPSNKNFIISGVKYKQDMYFGTSGGKIYRVNIKQNLFQDITQNIDSSSIMSLVIWKNKLYAGTYDKGIFSFDISQFYTSLTITEQPNDTIVVAESPVRFHCKSNVLNANYQWQLDIGLGFQNAINTNNISGSTNMDISFINAGLNLNNLKLRCLVTNAFDSVYSQTAVLKITSKSGFSNIDAQQIEIYPNPVNTNLQLKNAIFILGNSALYSIYDINGKIVRKGQLSDDSITVDDLSTGIYLLELKGISKKCIKFFKE